MGLSLEDEAEGLDPEAGVAWRGQVARGGPPWGATPTPVGEGEVVVKKQDPQEDKAAGVSSPARGRPSRRG